MNQEASGIAVHCAHAALVDITALIANPRNPNKHGDEQIALLSKIIRHQGWRAPIVVSKRSGFIVAGHGRLEAAKLLQVEKVPVDYQDFATEADEWAHLIADNRIAELAEIDDSELASLLKELDGKIDLDLAGFTDEALSEVSGFTEEGTADAEPQIDKAEELQKKWGTERGQVWQLGEHRLMCGDSTVGADVARIMGNDAAAILWTDPPYNVAYEGKTADALKIENDKMSDDDFVAFITNCLTISDKVMIPGAVYYISHPDIFAYEFIGAVRAVGWVQARPPVVQWVKDSMVMGRGDYHSRSEPILYGWKPGAAHQSVEDRTQDNVWEIPRPKSSEVHPTMKPVELVARALRNSSKVGAVVYEPFSGSGTTLIACENLKRRCRAMEISPAYVAVALQRWSDATGKTPVLCK